MQDFPTDWLPKRTIFILDLHEIVLAELFISDIYNMPQIIRKQSKITAQICKLLHTIILQLKYHN